MVTVVIEVRLVYSGKRAVRPVIEVRVRET